MIIWCFLSELKFSAKKSDASGWILSNALEQKRGTVINSETGYFIQFLQSSNEQLGERERAGAQ